MNFGAQNEEFAKMNFDLTKMNFGVQNDIFEKKMFEQFVNLKNLQANFDYRFEIYIVKQFQN